MRRLPPAVVLLLVAPAVGELASGATPITEYLNPVTFVGLTALYGCGALLVRELVVRWRRGWPSLLALGAAYAILEEGLVVQSFFDPGWQDLGPLASYGRAVGVSWVWAQHMVAFHAVVSIAVSVALAHLLMPDRREERWLTRGGWWACWAGLAAVWAVWEVLTRYEPGWWRLAGVAAVVALGVLARLLPDPAAAARRPPEAVVARPVPARPALFAAVGALGALGHFVLVGLAGERGWPPAGWFVLVLAAWDLGGGAAVLAMSGRTRAWDDGHRFALVAGVLGFFLVIGPLTLGSPVMAATSVVLGGLLVVLGRQVRRRAAGTAPIAPAT